MFFTKEPIFACIFEHKILEILDILAGGQGEGGGGGGGERSWPGDTGRVVVVPCNTVGYVLIGCAFGPGHASYSFFWHCDEQRLTVSVQQSPGHASYSLKCLFTKK